MDLDLLGSVVLGLYNELEYQKDCDEILNGLDSSETNNELKSWIDKGIEKLISLGKNDLAEKFKKDIEQLF